MESNPADYARAGTIFLSKSQTDMREKRKSLFINNLSNLMESKASSRCKHSSCSTIFLDDSTVSQPNLKYTIKCVALAIFYHIKNRDCNGGTVQDIFDEKLHPLSSSVVPVDYDDQEPEQKQIYRFVRTLFCSAQLTAECAIVTLVYLERLLTYAEMTISPGNWKRIVLGAIPASVQVWDDQGGLDVDYCQILQGHHRRGHAERKYSSCSTIFLDDSTVSQPNLKYTIKCVALAIFYHIKNRDCNGGTVQDIFDEKLHPLSSSVVPVDYDDQEPEQKQIYRFVRTLFCSAQLTAECAIVTLVYLERLLTYAEMTISPGNWKRIVLGAILLASKVWDDQAVWNVDYCQILKDITVEDMWVTLDRRLG
ncbi:hypothetical protein CRUP_020585 [Coryphaenoides rupestris]|nr:hypothetical protein CRUP_020585 [Coryphaenoides rupestris]